jgi:molybdopterin synthase sulfur carrier subunit
MKVLYFASLRERLNRSEDQVSPPAEVGTAGALLDWLAARDEALGLAIERRERFKVAVNARIVPLDHAIGPDDTIAILPPMTAG